MAAILLIDDSTVVHSVVEATLRAHGHMVESALDLKAGVKALRESSFDLILMDLNMPEVRGEAGIKMMRQRLHLETPIIILSGEITVETVLSMKPLGVSGFVAKGEDFETRLVQEISGILPEPLPPDLL